ncbi:hypothetical protein AB4344_19075 [Vibrio breoganii]
MVTAKVSYKQSKQNEVTSSHASYKKSAEKLDNKLKKKRKSNKKPKRKKLTSANQLDLKLLLPVSFVYHFNDQTQKCCYQFSYQRIEFEYSRRFDNGKFAKISCNAKNLQLWIDPNHKINGFRLYLIDTNSGNLVHKAYEIDKQT